MAVAGGVRPGEEPSRNEKIKAASVGLRGSLGAEVADKSKANFSPANAELLKFHGIYQEKSRDKPPDAATNPPIYMVRARIPGGRMSAAAWRVFDDVATQHGEGSLRLTTRCTLQLHYVPKASLPAVHSALASVFPWGSQGACGDVVRNVSQAPNPLRDPRLAALDELADVVSSRYLATTKAYREIWLSGGTPPPPPKVAEHDPVYGTNYMPRKFKIGVTVAGDNSVDLLSNDLGYAATFAPGAGAGTAPCSPDGYFLWVGGGHGRSHAQPATWAAQGQLLGWVPSRDVLRVSDAIIQTQRLYGCRSDRKHARLKYTIEDLGGIDAFRRAVASAAAGAEIDTSRRPPPWTVPPYLGWREQRDGRWSVGVHIMAGRVQDVPGNRIKSALAKAVAVSGGEVVCTPDQDVLLCDISPCQKAAVAAAFASHNIDTEPPPPVYRRALACVALPTCALAITDAERALPGLVATFHAVLRKAGMGGEAPVFRVTGCPNGCARPYSAEVALVGQTPATADDPAAATYQVYVGGCPNGSRANELLAERVPVGAIPALLAQLVDAWRSHRRPGESLGDFTHRFPRPHLNRLLAAIPAEARLDAVDAKCGVTPSAAACAAAAAAAGPAPSK